MTDLISDMKSTLEDVSNTEFSPQMYTQVLEELKSMPRMVEEIKNKAQSYAALAKEAGVSTGHKTLGGEHAWA